jgi:ABC-type transport system involved in cytochrome c biogenesis permease subunit
MNLSSQPIDHWILTTGAALLVLAMLLAWRQLVGAAASPAGVAFRPTFAAADLALLALAVGIALRWERIGHGPFLSMYEILASSLLTLSLAWRIASWRVPVLRESAPVALSLLAIMGAWLLVTDPADTHLPATYEMTILWVHVAVGKVFLACAFVATGLAGVIVLRQGERGQRWFRRMPDTARLDKLAWRFMLTALIFETLMLIAGAVWAQDAWGRFWAWDPLETWSFITWVALSAAVHARLTWRLGAFRGALMILGVFVLAFLTFFGVPFVTLAPHKGAV